MKLSRPFDIVKAVKMIGSIGTGPNKDGTTISRANIPVFSLSQVKIDKSGFDPNGKYYGKKLNNKLFRAYLSSGSTGQESQTNFELWATDRDNAKALIRLYHKNARFFR